MRLTIIGGGGFRVPLVYGALVDDRGGHGNHGDVRVDEVVLYDVDASRMEVIAHVLAQMAEERPDAPTVVTTTDLDAAVRGAAFVFCAVRVGGLEGRVVDERVPLAEGVLGQETVGPGGVSFGLRTVPVMTRVAGAVAALAPGAWVIDFTNPVGMVTEAMARVLGDRVIGICDTPVGLCLRVARALGVDPARAWFDYFGLNHLGWLRRVLVDGEDRLPDLLTGDALASFEEGRLFGASWLRALGMVPNEYLFYYYCSADAVRATAQRPASRGEFLLDQQSRFYATVAADPGRALAEWLRVRRERDATYMAEGREAAGGGERGPYDTAGGGYERVALALMAAIARNERAVLILNVRNRSALPALDADAVVEVPCVVGAHGASPLAVGEVPDGAAGLMRVVKGVERATIEAALTGSRSAALAALGMHPLVGSPRQAERILDGYVARQPALADLFGTGSAS